MVKRAVIFGARRDGSAKVVLDILRLTGEYDVVGFLDDNAGLWGTRVEHLEVLGGSDRLESLRSLSVSHIAFALGDNRQKERLLQRAQACGLTPATVTHPTAVVAKGVRLGVGTWMAAHAAVNPGAVLGDGVVINTGATVDHDCVIGDYANISPGCHLSGRTTIGRYAFLGTGAVTIPDVLVGEGAIVGAGAVVIRDVPPGVTVVGVPAQALGRA
jgi:acetyltransferase EpsM